MDLSMLWVEELVLEASIYTQFPAVIFAGPLAKNHCDQTANAHIDEGGEGGVVVNENESRFLL